MGMSIPLIPQFKVNGKWGTYAAGTIVFEGEIIAQHITEIEGAKWVHDLEDLQSLQNDLDALIGESNMALLTPADIDAEERKLFGIQDIVEVEDPEPEFDPNKYRSDDVREEG
jgi:hypothetical protein